MPIFRKMSALSKRKNILGATREDEKTAQAIAAFVDAEYYLNANPDVRSAGLDPVMHYVCFGWQEGRDPSPGFSTSAYIAQNPDVKAKNLNPLAHFAKSIKSDAHDTPPAKVTMDIIRDAFDHTFYQKKYGKDPTEGTDPLEHYCTSGWRAGYDPNRWFSTSHYLTSNADVRASGVNPFWHYLVAGKEEGRTPQDLRCWQLDAATKLKPLEHLKREWMRAEATPRLLKDDDLCDLLNRALCNETVLVSFGHDDYRSVPGGVQLCIGIEQIEAQNQGIRHLNLHPWQVLPMLADTASDPILCLVLDGGTQGYARTSALTTAIGRVRDAEIHMVVHHFAGHSIEGIAAFADAAGASHCTFWLHDYFALCTSYTLMRNAVEDCGAPDLGSNACDLCLFGEERRAQNARFAAFFAHIDVDLISPSEVALALWQDRGTLATRSAVVRPHVTLRKKQRSAKDTGAIPDAIRIGFIGSLSPHKGWPVFEELSRRLSDDPRFEFWVFNAMESDLPDMNRVCVHARSVEPKATRVALEEAQIDLVVHWATWRETFSFSTFEAIAAGAFVLTNKGSGNVAKAVQDHDAGLVLDTVDALYELAESDGLNSLAARARQRRKNLAYTLEIGDMAVSEVSRKPLSQKTVAA